MPTKDNILIGQILIDKGLINPEQLEAGLRQQKKTGDFICTSLVKLGFVSENEIFPLLASQLQISYLSLKSLAIEPEALEKVPAKFASHYKIMPLKLKNNQNYSSFPNDNGGVIISGIPTSFLSIASNLTLGVEDGV